VGWTHRQEHVNKERIKRQADIQAGRHTDRQTYRQADIQAGRHTVRQTYRQADGQRLTKKQKERGRRTVQT
jgi:hypothetical protein